ncbi:MAG: membrane protein insertase YidC [Alcanivoracaceae bacterium]|nr:membrane protein insertase YidC [Alcanivoracaceae bacterium]
MEIQRTLVIIGLAVVTYMMVLAYQEDYGQQPSASIATRTEEASSVPDVSDAPVTVEQMADVGSDVPSADDIPVAESDAPAPVAAKPDADRLVQVKTDVFTVTIDRQGGDIVNLGLLNYPTHFNTPDEPFPLLLNTPEHFQVMQSGLIGRNGTDTAANRPVWLADKTAYSMPDSATELNVDLKLYQDNNVVITKRYTFVRGSYLVRVSHIVENKGDQSWQGALYGQIKRDNSDDPSKAKAGFAPMPTFLGAAWWTEETPYNKTKLGDLEEEPLKTTQEGGWIGMVQHYFLSAWIPDNTQSNTFSSSYLSKSEQHILRFVSPPKTVEPNNENVFYAEFYAGPKVQSDLEAISPGLNMTVDFGWLWFVSQPIFALLIFLQSGHVSIFGNEFDIGFGVTNWGVAIILLTLVIKSLFFKLSASSYRSMAKMRKVAPEMQRIKEQFKSDRQKQQQETMKLFQREKINPLGGCLPMLVQMPVFIALYYVLLESVELRQVPFFGWIQDLSVMDPYFILPILMGASMFLQSRLNPTPADPTQAQVMKWMPMMFAVFMLWFPAGLVLYWLTNNILSISQQWIITRRIESE